MLSEREYMQQFGISEEDVQVDLSPITIIVGGPKPVPDPSTPEGRHEINVDALIFAIVILAIIIGTILYPN